MSLNQHFKKWSWLFGIAGFSLMVAAIFVLPQYLKRFGGYRTAMVGK